MKDTILSILKHWWSFIIGLKEHILPTSSYTIKEIIERADNAHDFAVLVEKFNEVNQDIAQRLRNVVALGAGRFDFTNSLETAFYWHDTNEGNAFWNDANHIKLPEIGVSDDYIKEYFDIVKKVATFDLNAAEKLIMFPFTLDVFNYGDLGEAFVWSDTDEGHNYWSDIALKIWNNGGKK